MGFQSAPDSTRTKSNLRQPGGPGWSQPAVREPSGVRVRQVQRKETLVFGWSHSLQIHNASEDRSPLASGFQFGLPIKTTTKIVIIIHKHPSFRLFLQPRNCPSLTDGFMPWPPQHGGRLLRRPGGTAGSCKEAAEVAGWAQGTPRPPADRSGPRSEECGASSAPGAGSTSAALAQESVWPF